jgi:hypothetical protein
MNIEELKLVLETVATVTDDAKSVAIWYIVLNFGGGFILQLSMLIGVLFTIVRVVRYIVSANEWAKIGAKLSNAWGGYSSSVFSSPDDRSVVDAIGKCITASKECKKS